MAIKVIRVKSTGSDAGKFRYNFDFPWTSHRTCIWNIKRCIYPALFVSKPLLVIDWVTLSYLRGNFPKVNRKITVTGKVGWKLKFQPFTTHPDVPCVHPIQDSNIKIITTEEKHNKSPRVIRVSGRWFVKNDNLNAVFKAKANAVAS